MKRYCQICGMSFASTHTCTFTETQRAKSAEHNFEVENDKVRELTAKNERYHNALDEIRSGGLYYGQWQDIANKALKDK